MVVATISILISSIALVGVAVSLLLQARQLRVSQLQISHAAQFDLLKVGLDNPKLIAGLLEEDPDSFAGAIYINWTTKYMELSYEIKALTADAVRLQAKLMFSAQFARSWWINAKPLYNAEATTKRENDFVALLDEVYEQAILGSGIGDKDDRHLESPPSAPSS
jgi:hypothetical protein